MHTTTDFLNIQSSWGSHRKLLHMALESTCYEVDPVIELGCGYESTPYLREYCQEYGRNFFSYENKVEWAVKFGSTYVENWDKSNLWDTPYSVCLLDLAPGNYRKIALMKITATIIIIHDSEPIGWNPSDYKVRPLFDTFKYRIDDEAEVKGEPWTTAVSNYIDVSKWKIS